MLSVFVRDCLCKRRETSRKLDTVGLGKWGMVLFSHPSCYSSLLHFLHFLPDPLELFLQFLSDLLISSHLLPGPRNLLFFPSILPHFPSTPPPSPHSPPMLPSSPHLHLPYLFPFSSNPPPSSSYPVPHLSGVPLCSVSSGCGSRKVCAQSGSSCRPHKWPRLQTKPKLGTHFSPPPPKKKQHVYLEVLSAQKETRPDVQRATLGSVA